MNERELLIELLATDSIIREIEDTEMYNTDDTTLYKLRTHAHKTVDQLTASTDIMTLVDERKEELVRKYHLR